MPGSPFSNLKSSDIRSPSAIRTRFLDMKMATIFFACDQYLHDGFKVGPGVGLKM